MESKFLTIDSTGITPFDAGIGKMLPSGMDFLQKHSQLIYLFVFAALAASMGAPFCASGAFRMTNHGG